MTYDEEEMNAILIHLKLKFGLRHKTLKVRKVANAADARLGIHVNWIPALMEFNLHMNAFASSL